MSGVHHFVPVLHRGDAVGRHTLRLRDATRARGLQLEHLRRRRPGRDGRGHRACPGLPGRGRTGRRRRLPVRHRLHDGALARRPHRDAGRELPQRHATRTHEAMGSPPGAGPGPCPERPRGAGARTTLAVADSGYNETHLAEAGFAATAVIAPSAELRALDRRTRRHAAHPSQGRRDKAAGRRRGFRSDGSHPTSRSSTPSPPWPSPGCGVTPAPRSGSSANRPPKPMTGRSAATSRSWACSTRSASRATPATPRWPRPTPPRTCSWWPRSTRASACPSSRRWRPACPWWPSTRGLSPRSSVMRGSSSPPGTPTRWPTAIADLLDDGPRRADLVQRGKRRVTELQLDSTAERFVDLLVPLLEPGGLAQDRRRRR